MSELPVNDESGARDPASILRRLPESERESFLAEYRAALDAAHEVWRYRQLQDVLRRWDLIAFTTSRPGYAEALAEARNATGPGMSIDEITARRADR
jgi:hypothetical protein